MESLRELIDHIEIGQLLQRYFLALDEKRYELLDHVFTADAHLRYEMSPGAPTSTYRDMLPAFQRFNEQFSFTLHHMGLPSIELGKDIARSRTSLRAEHVQEAADGRPHLWVVHGFYRDVHSRTPDGWRIHDRWFRCLHTEGELLPADSVRSFPVPPWRDDPPAV